MSNHIGVLNDESRQQRPRTHSLARRSTRAPRRAPIPVHRSSSATANERHARAALHRLQGFVKMWTPNDIFESDRLHASC
jgi:hypothetical protein